VVFLYQLQQGVCPRSYGMNVALAAGLPQEVRLHARQPHLTLADRGTRKRDRGGVRGENYASISRGKGVEKPTERVIIQESDLY
jgi:DNA mismatch repair ATPase MutS